MKKFTLVQVQAHNKYTLFDNFLAVQKGKESQNVS